MMRLLLLTDITYPCDHLPFPAAVFNQRFVERGHELVWVMRSGEAQEGVRKTEWKGNPVYTLPRRGYDPKRVFARYATGQLASHPVFDIERAVSPIDALYVRNDLAMGLVASLLSARQSIPYFHRISHLKAETTKHRAKAGLEDGRAGGYLKGMLGQTLRKYVCNRANHVFPISDSMSEYLDEAGYCTSSTVIPTGVDCRRAQPRNSIQFRSEFGISTDKNLLVYIGTLGPERRPRFLLDVLNAVADEYDVVLAVLGGRQNRRIESLRAYAQEIGVADRTVFTGWIDNQATIDRAIATADVALSPLPPDVPSLFHSSPVKVNEYLRQETPVIGTDIPDHRYVIEGSNGGYCVDYERSLFAEAIGKLLSDPDLRERMGRGGRQFVESTRCYDKLTDRMLESFANVTGESWH
jgi:glycosyltransferase involved in cell wall biosynthesis